MCRIPLMTGEGLKKVRGDLGFSQKQLAKILGVAGNTVSRWEIGASPIPEYLELAIVGLESRIKSKGWGEISESGEQLFCFYAWDEREKSNVLRKIPLKDIEKEISSLDN